MRWSAHAVIDKGAAALHRHQQGAAQFLEMVGDQRLGQAQLLHDGGDGFARRSPEYRRIRSRFSSARLLARKARVGRLWPGTGDSS